MGLIQPRISRADKSALTILIWIAVPFLVKSTNIKLARKIRNGLAGWVVINQGEGPTRPTAVIEI